MYAVGEGLQKTCSLDQNTNLNKEVYSFHAFGLDFFENQIKGLKSKGYINATFNSAGTATAIDLLDENYILPNPFNREYAIIRYADGSTVKRRESADNGNIVDVYPVLFKNLEFGIEGACAVYANAYDYTVKSAENIGWGNLTLNQHVFFAYVKIQKTSEKGNAEINRYRNKPNANFLDENYTTTKNDGKNIANKCYHRWVAWRYILLGKHFSK